MSFKYKRKINYYETDKMGVVHHSNYIRLLEVYKDKEDFIMNNVVQELKNVGTFYIATVEGDQPRVRPFSSVTEFEGNVYLCSGNQKEVFKQIMSNPKIELCGMSKSGDWLRVSAVAVRDERIEAQEAMLNDPTGPSQLYTAGDGRFEVFKLDNVKCLKYNFYAAPQEIKEHE